MDYTHKIEKKEGHGSKNRRDGGWNKEEKRERKLGKAVTPQMHGQTA